MSSEEFIIDALGDSYKSSSDSDSEFELPAYRLASFKGTESSSKVPPGDLYVNVNPSSLTRQDYMEQLKKMCCESRKEIEKKRIDHSGAAHTNVPTSLRQQKKIRKMAREKTKGYQWHDMKAPEMTEEKKNDLTVLQMRKVLDPKHFYKRSALNPDSFPKYFEVGTYEESPLDFYSSRIPKKQRKRTLVEELMADAEFCSYQKKKLSEILKSQPKKFHKKKQSKKSKVKKTATDHSAKKQKKKS